MLIGQWLEGQYHHHHHHYYGMTLLACITTLNIKVYSLPALLIYYQPLPHREIVVVVVVLSIHNPNQHHHYSSSSTS